MRWLLATQVGGPATAAAFAATRWPELVAPAVIWGTVGYAAGTGLGLRLFSIVM